MADRSSKPDLGGALGAAAFAALGAGAWWAAGEFSDLGAVFPRTVGALLVVFGIAYVGLVLLGRTHAVAPLEGSRRRRAGVAAVMLGWAFALEPLGFVASSALASALLLVVAQHGRWSARTAVVHGLAVAAVLGALYALFKLALQVPLP